MVPILAAVVLAYALIKAGQYRMPELAPLNGSPWAVSGWAGPTGWWDAIRVATYDSLFTGRNVSGFMNVLWTMNIEFYGSLLVFAVALVVGKLRRRWFLYAVLAVFFLKSYYLAFIIGMSLADLHSTRPDALKMKKVIAASALSGGLLMGATQIPGLDASLVYDSLARWGLSPTTTFVLSHVLGAGLVFLSLFSFSGLRTFFSCGPMRYLGRISFFVYLLHLPVLASFGVYAFFQFNPSLGYVWGGIASLALSLPIIVIMADIFTRLVDDNAVGFSKYAYRRIYET